MAASGVGSVATHKAVLNHPWDTELQRQAGKCKISVGSQELQEACGSGVVFVDDCHSPVTIPFDGALVVEQHSSLCNTGVDHVDAVLAHPCSIEQLVHGEVDATVLQDQGQQITDQGDVSSTLLPPSVDWAGILRAQEGPWLRGVNRDYIEVSFCLLRHRD